MDELESLRELLMKQSAEIEMLKLEIDRLRIDTTVTEVRNPFIIKETEDGSTPDKD